MTNLRPPIFRNQPLYYVDKKEWVESQEDIYNSEYTSEFLLPGEEGCPTCPNKYIHYENMKKFLYWIKNGIWYAAHIDKNITLEEFGIYCPSKILFFCYDNIELNYGDKTVKEIIEMLFDFVNSQEGLTEKMSSDLIKKVDIENIISDKGKKMITDEDVKESFSDKGEKMITDEDIIEENSSDKGEKMIINREHLEIRAEKRAKEIVKDVFKIMKMINSTKKLAKEKGYNKTVKVLDNVFISLFDEFEDN